MSLWIEVQRKWGISLQEHLHQVRLEGTMIGWGTPIGIYRHCTPGTGRYEVDPSRWPRSEIQTLQSLIQIYDCLHDWLGVGHFWSLLGIIAQLTDHSWNSLTTNKKMSWFQLEPGGLRNPAMRPSSRRRHCCRWKLRLNAGSKPLNYVGSCWFQLLL